MTQRQDQEFENIVRNKLTNIQFWNWIKEWKDIESLIEETLQWNDQAKKQQIKDWQKQKVIK